MRTLLIQESKQVSGGSGDTPFIRMGSLSEMDPAIAATCVVIGGFIGLTKSIIGNYLKGGSTWRSPGGQVTWAALEMTVITGLLGYADSRRCQCCKSSVYAAYGDSSPYIG